MPTLPSTSLINVNDERVIPPDTAGGVEGWIYLNRDDNPRDAFAKQNWIVVSMRAENRFSVDIDALALGNGCSAPVSESQANDGSRPIGPAPSVRP